MKAELTYEQAGVVLDALNSQISMFENHYYGDQELAYKLRTDGKQRIEKVKLIILDMRMEWREKEAVVRRKKEAKVYKRYITGCFKTKKAAAEALKVDYSKLLRIIRENEGAKQNESNYEN